MAQQDYVIGIGMGLDPSGLKQGLADAKTEIALAKSEFEAAAGWDKNWIDSIDGVQAKIKQMTTELDAKASIVQAWRDELDRVSEAYGENSTEAKQVQTKLNNAEKDYKRAEQYTKDLQTKLEDLKKAEEDAGKAADDLADDIDDMGEEADDTQSGPLDKLKNKLGDLKGSVADKVKEGLGNIKEKFKDLASNGIGKAVDALKSFMKGVINIGKDFTSTMSMVRANSGASEEDMEKLEAVAKEMGATTTFSAVESAEALNYMALAGWNAEQSASALGGILDLAASSQMDLADASDLVTDYLAPFGMEARQAGHFADVMAYAQSHANTTTAMLGEAFENVAAVMGPAGQSLETTTALLMGMANQGSKGSRAGTMLAAVMRDITKKMKDGAIQIGDTSIAVADEEGNFRDLISILYDARKATQGMGNAEAQSALMTTFTADSIRAVNEIFTEGTVAVGQYRNELKKSDGAAKSISSIMNDNLSGDMKQLDSAVQDIQLGIFDLIEGPLRTIVQLATQAIRGIKWLAEQIYNGIKILWDNGLGPVVDAIAGAWDTITGAFSGAGDFFGKVWEGIKNAFSGAVTWFFNLGGDTAKNLKKAWEGIKTFFGNVWNGIKGAFDGAISWFFSLGGDMAKNLKKAWDGIKSFFGNVWGGIKDAFTGAISWFFSLGGDMAKNLKKAWEGIKSWFGDRWNDIKNAFSGAKDALSGVASNMRAGLESGWNGLTSWAGGLWNSIKGAFGGAKDALSGVASNMRAGLESGWNGLTSWAGGLWNSIKGAFSDPLGTFSGIAASIRSGLQSGWDAITGWAGTIWNSIKSPFEGVGQWFSDTFGGAYKAITDAFGGIKKFFEGIWNGILGVFKPVLGFFGIEVQGGSDPLADQRAEVERLKKAYDDAQKAYNSAQSYWLDANRTYGYGSSQERSAYERYLSQSDALNKAVSAYTAAKNALDQAEKSGEGQGIGGIASSIQNAFSGITDIITKPFTAAWDAITGVFGGIGTWFMDNVVSPVSNALGGIVGAVGDVVGGVGQGIADGVGGVVDGVKSFGQGIVDGICDFFRIGSPSKLMRDEVGLMIGAGVAEGIRDSVGMVGRASDELSGAVSVGGSLGAGGRAGAGTVIYNQTINSPDPLSAGQIYRDTRSLMARREWA